LETQGEREKGVKKTLGRGDLVGEGQQKKKGDVKKKTKKRNRKN